jgi:large subunit ribosomal protein L4
VRPQPPADADAGRAADAGAGRTPTAPAAAPDAESPFGPGSVRALPDGSSPEPGFTVKAKVATRVFHVPGGAYFSRTKADVWFRTEDDARAAGFAPWAPRRRS